MRFTILEAAHICHEVNRAYCIAQGDLSQPRWEEAPDWQKNSAVEGVKFHLSGARSPAESHANWLHQKINDGWSYGPVKDPDKKEHPCLVPYDKLPLEQQSKDYLFTALVACLRPYIVPDGECVLVIQKAIGQRNDEVDARCYLPGNKTTVLSMGDNGLGVLASALFFSIFGIAHSQGWLDREVSHV